MKIKTNTKIYAGVLLTILLLVSAYSVLPLTRTISDSHDTVETFIKTSDGNYFATTNIGIQSALDSLTNGGTVWLPGNTTITITTELTPSNNTNIIGTGYSTCLFQGNSANVDLIDITSKENIIIEKIRFDSNNDSNTGNNPCIDIQSSGVGGTATKNITIRDCWFYNCETSMVDVHYDDNTWAVTVEDCFFKGIERDIGEYPAGVWISGFNCVIKNNWFEDCFGSGIVVESTDAKCASNIIIDGNSVTGFTGYGILCEGGGDSANNTIVNNHCWNLNSTSYLAPESSYSTGILVTGNSTVANNWVYNVHRYGLYVHSNDTIIIGNRIDTIQNKIGIQIRGNATCSNNIIKNTNKNGILASNQKHLGCSVIITGNWIANTKNEAIEVGYSGAMQHCIISNNKIENTAQDGIELIDVENSSIMGNTFTTYVLAIDEASSCHNNTYIGNIATDDGHDYDLDGTNWIPDAANFTHLNRGTIVP